MSGLNRRSRILGIQKNTLVQLVENHFIRHFGHHSNVNLESISLITWQKFANILNNLGPTKTVAQWKSSFSSMHNRVRKKMALILQSDANPEDNLSKLDLKIYRMLPNVNYALLDGEVNESCDPNSFGGEGSREHVDHEETNYDNIRSEEMDHGHSAYDETNRDRFGYEEGGDYVDHEETDNDHVIYKELDREYVGYEELEDDHANYADLQNDNDYYSEIASAKVDSGHILVAENEEELDRYNIDSVIIEDESDDSTDAIICLDDDQLNCSTDNERAVSINRIVTSEPNSSKNVPQAPRGAVESDEVKKTSARIPDIQKERLVQLVQNNFTKLVGRFAGANGVYIKKQLWANIAKELNQLGPARTGEQWKTTFDGIKASAKEKLANDHNKDNETVSKSLNRLEEKIVAIYGIDSLDGDQRLGEAGFRYKKRYTSYDMVQRSIQQQEYFMEQTGRNHAEMMYSSDRNHAQIIGIFNSTLQTIANVARDIFKKD